MKQEGKYNIERVVGDLKSKRCDVKGMNIDIEVPYKNNSIGNKTWGKLDFLTRQGFRVSGFFESKDYIPMFEKRS